MPRTEPQGFSVPFFRAFYPYNGSAVAGTWAWEHNTGQTDFAITQQYSAGVFLNTTTANADEYTWGALFLTKGKYKVGVSYRTSYTSGGIGEVLFGNTSLITQDMYATSNNYNQTFNQTFRLVDNTTANVRIKANDKNTSSTGYLINFSRFEIEKVG